MVDNFKFIYLGIDGYPPKEFKFLKGFILYLHADSDLYREMLLHFKCNNDEASLARKILKYVKEGIAILEKNEQAFTFKLIYDEKSYKGIVFLQDKGFHSARLISSN